MEEIQNTNTAEQLATIDSLEKNIEKAIESKVVENAEITHKSTGPLSESGWVAVAFALFVVLFIKKVWPHLANALDARSLKIADELKEAKLLKEEAQDLLAEAQRNSADAEKAAVEMVETAKSEAKRIAQKAEADMNEEADRKLTLVKQKIKRAEQQAIESVKKEAVDEAVKLATKILATNSAKNHKSLLSESIAKITGSIN